MKKNIIAAVASLSVLTTACTTVAPVATVTPVAPSPRMPSIAEFLVQADACVQQAYKTEPVNLSPTIQAFKATGTGSAKVKCIAERVFDDPEHNKVVGIWTNAQDDFKDYLDLKLRQDNPPKWSAHMLEITPDGQRFKADSNNQNQVISNTDDPFFNETMAVNVRPYGLTPMATAHKPRS